MVGKGLEARWARHRHTTWRSPRLGPMGLSLASARTGAAVDAERDPRARGRDEAAVRKQLLQQFDIEVGAGLGPLAGRLPRVGLMGA